MRKNEIKHSLSIFLSIFYIQKYICTLNGTDMYNLKERIHNETKNITQVRYGANTLCSTETTLDKLCKNTVQKSDCKTKHPSVRGIT